MAITNRDPKVRAKIARLYQEGVGVKALRERFAPLSKDTINQILEEFNVPRKDRTLDSGDIPPLFI